MERLDINVDFDGVIHSFYDAASNAVQFIHGNQYKVLTLEELRETELCGPKWEFYKYWRHANTGKPMTQAMFWDTIRVMLMSIGGADIVFGDPGNLIPGAAETLAALAQHHNLHLVTCKNWTGPPYKNAVAAMHRLLEAADLDHLFNSINVVRVGDKFRYHADVAIDDNPNIHEWATAEGVVFAQPWNDHMPTRYTWKEIGEKYG